MKSGFSYVRDVYESGTEPGPEYYICHPNAVTATHVWRRILCNSTHTSAAPSLQDSVCVCVYEYVLPCICAFICAFICVYDVCLWHLNMCICTCVQVCVQVCAGAPGKTNVIFDCAAVFTVFVWQIDMCTDGGWWTYAFYFTLYMLTWQQC